MKHIPLDDGILQPHDPRLDLTFRDVMTGETSRIPLTVIQWLSTIDQDLALSIVEAYYASEN